jgi:endonuclease V-like protein UPF0215 family
VIAGLRRPLHIPDIGVHILDFATYTSEKSSHSMSQTIIIIIQLMSQVSIFSHFNLCYVLYINKLNCTPLIIMVFEHPKMKIQYALQKHK